MPNSDVLTHRVYYDGVDGASNNEFFLSVGTPRELGEHFTFVGEFEVPDDKTSDFQRIVNSGTGKTAEQIRQALGGLLK